MTAAREHWVAVVLLALLGAGIIGVMVLVVMRDGQLSGDDGGWVTAAFLSLREVFSKIEKIALGGEPAQLPGHMVGD